MRFTSIPYQVREEHPPVVIAQSRAVRQAAPVYWLLIGKVHPVPGKKVAMHLCTCALGQPVLKIREDVIKALKNGIGRCRKAIFMVTVGEPALHE